jgi:hypothetical protein
MRLLARLFAFYFPPVAVSAEIGAVLGSFHFSQRNLNEFNPGLYVVLDRVYKNGYYDRTIAGVKT